MWASKLLYNNSEECRIIIRRSFQVFLSEYFYVYKIYLKKVIQKLKFMIISNKN